MWSSAQNGELHVIQLKLFRIAKFQAFAVVHCIKIVFFGIVKTEN